jgi:RNase P subunit RPR2
VLLIVSTTQRQGKMGINVRATACPKCQTPLPTFRKPASLRQMLWGGWTCAQCGTDLDKWGQPVARG